MKELIDNLFSLVSKEELQKLLFIQLKNFFLISKEEFSVLNDIQPLVLNRLRDCIKGVDNKYFRLENKTFFSPYHSGQYLIYLYYFSNEIYRQLGSASTLCDRLYYLNKILHSCDIYYAIELPKVFFLEHPVGTVLGRAKYGNNFFAMQGCTVGGNKGVYPIIGDNVKMYSNSKIIGKSNIGDNVMVGANCFIKDLDIQDNTTVYGQYPNLTIIERNSLPKNE